MSDRVGIVWDDRLAAYDFGPKHPLTPIRVQLAMRLVREFGLLDHANVTTLTPVNLAEIEDVLRVHAADYVQAVQHASIDPGFRAPAYGLGTSDNPVFAGMHEASLRVAGATMTAARAVRSGEFDHAVNLAGGLHHAMPGLRSGRLKALLINEHDPGDREIAVHYAHRQYLAPRVRVVVDALVDALAGHDDLQVDPGRLPGAWVAG